LLIFVSICQGKDNNVKNPNKNGLPVLAVDIGGTKIIAALITPEGEIETRIRALTGAAGGKDASLNNLFLAIGDVLHNSGHKLEEIHSISIAAAGAINMAMGVVTASPNLPGWFDVPLLALVRERYRADSFLLNDAKAAALAEHDFGAGKGVKNMIFLTISTGIGDDKLVFGTSGVAGELGHMTVEASGPLCLCGNTGCMEIMACGRAIALDARERVKKGANSILTELAGGNIDNITAETVDTAARKGDAVALEVVNRAALYLGVGMANIANIFNPGMIVVGGGVSKMGDLLLNPVRRVVRERAFKLAADDAAIVQAKFGDDAGVLGAASYAYSLTACLPLS
jgi:glucokinase